MIRMVFKAKYSRYCGRTKRETKGKNAVLWVFLALRNENLILLMELIFTKIHYALFQNEFLLINVSVNHRGYKVKSFNQPLKLKVPDLKKVSGR